MHFIHVLEKMNLTRLYSIPRKPDTRWYSCVEHCVIHRTMIVTLRKKDINTLCTILTLCSMLWKGVARGKYVIYRTGAEVLEIKTKMNGKDVIKYLVMS